MRTCPEGFASVDGTAGQPMPNNTNGWPWLQYRQGLERMNLGALGFAT